MPIKRLILLDLVLTFGTALGFLLLVIPGLIWLAYFSLAPALIKFEHRGVWDSMRRSRELVRGNFWRGDVDRGRDDRRHRARGRGGQRPVPQRRARSSVVDLVADGLLQPIEGLVIVVVTLNLLELRGELPEQTELARAVGDIHDCTRRS